MSEELKPCPFDGAKGDDLGLTYEGFDARLNWFVRCYHCCVETQRYDSEEEAIATWNRRASPTPEGRGGEDGLTPAQRAKLVALEKAATPAPWRAMMQGNSRLLDGTHVGQARLEPVPRPYEPRWVGFQNEATALEWHHSTVMREEDAELVAMMRNLLPALLSSPRVERERALEEAAKACLAVGADWEIDGQFHKSHAADYLAAHIRSLSTG